MSATTLATGGIDRIWRVLAQRSSTVYKTCTKQQLWESKVSIGSQSRGIKRVLEIETSQGKCLRESEVDLSLD